MRVRQPTIPSPGFRRTDPSRLFPAVKKMAHRLFEGKEHAASYWKYRISPSDQLMQQVFDFLEKQSAPPYELAVDVGCGSGQGTLRLAKHFASVLGTDVSPAQLEMALQHATQPNITYKQCVAEELPLADSSVDLLTAMSAFHWFDRPRFLQEAHRVLKPRGCLALLNYTIDMELSYQDCCSDTLNQICKEFYTALQPYRSSHLGQTSINFYRETFHSLPYPDKEWQECVWDRRTMPLSSYIGFVQSFSSYQALLREDPQKAAALSKDICQRLMSVMQVSSADTEVVVAVKYFYLLACKPQET
ncbi:putative methyltransferase DDB_G0268948 isoform X2 [Salarias fasciatus]|uniref:putative methyltransferase DDB_G0268948 isoform X2 n=1 Tax=Salarias fasciatus TaxID=181472 RepID=UPI0011766FE7|nr:putative methyltransferase DDB_G0268948 isoform X2 [Salarias fasciatus]